MNKENHTVTLPMKEYEELLKAFKETESKTNIAEYLVRLLCIRYGEAGYGTHSLSVEHSDYIYKIVVFTDYHSREKGTDLMVTKIKKV